ncbi:hypothetical protein PS15m_003422 [Mucor circinelloides]
MVSPDIGGPYRKLSLQFVDSIETMKADFVEEVDWDCVAQLTQFKKVKTFALKGVLDNFDIMEQILSNCPPEMQTVTLTTFGFDSASTWEQEITKKCYGVTKFTILHGMITIELLNYELYKFANLDTIVIYFVLFRELHDMNMHRIPTIISKVPHWDVVFSIPLETNLRDALIQLKSDEYAIGIGNSKITGNVLLRITWH